MLPKLILLLYIISYYILPKHICYRVKRGLTVKNHVGVDAEYTSSKVMTQSCQVRTATRNTGLFATSQPRYLATPCSTESKRWRHVLRYLGQNTFAPPSSYRVRSGLHFGPPGIGTHMTLQQHQLYTKVCRLCNGLKTAQYCCHPVAIQYKAGPGPLKSGPQPSLTDINDDPGPWWVK